MPSPSTRDRVALATTEAPMKQKQRRPRTPPLVQVERDDEPVDVRAFARTYVNLLFTLEGIATVPSSTTPLKQAS